MTKDDINDARKGIKELVLEMAKIAETIGRPAQEIEAVKTSISPMVDELCDFALRGLSVQPYRDALRYRWLNQQHHFLMYIEQVGGERSKMRLRCGEPLDAWVDARIEEEQKRTDEVQESK